MYGRGNRRAYRKLSKLAIDSVKNYVQVNQAVAAASIQLVQLAVAVKPGTIDETNPANIADVEAGSRITGFNISGRIFSESGVADSGSVVWFIRKNEGGTLAPATAAQGNSLGTTPWKARIFHAEQAIVGSQVSGLPMGVTGLRIPKRFQAMRNLDVWELYVVNNTANQIRACYLVEYKWYR